MQQIITTVAIGHLMCKLGNWPTKVAIEQTKWKASMVEWSELVQSSNPNNIFAPVLFLSFLLTFPISAISSPPPSLLCPDNFKVYQFKNGLTLCQVQLQALQLISSVTIGVYVQFFKELTPARQVLELTLIVPLSARQLSQRRFLTKILCPP